MDEIFYAATTAIINLKAYEFTHKGVEYTVKPIASGAVLIARANGRERIETLSWPFEDVYFWELVGELRGQLKVNPRYAPMTLPYANYREASAAIAEDRCYDFTVDGISLKLSKAGDVADWCHLQGWKGAVVGEPVVDVLLHRNFGPAQFWFAVGEATTEAL